VVRAETHVSAKAELCGPLHHHHQEEGMWEQAMQEKVQGNIMKEELAEKEVHPLLHLDHRLGAEICPHLHYLLHHQSHRAVQIAPMVQTHLVLVRCRKEVILLTQNVKFVSYTKN
jgi:hypothetical protein